MCDGGESGWLNNGQMGIFFSFRGDGDQAQLFFPEMINGGIDKYPSDPGFKGCFIGIIAKLEAFHFPENLDKPIVYDFQHLFLSADIAMANCISIAIEMLVKALLALAFEGNASLYQLLKQVVCGCRNVHVLRPIRSPVAPGCFTKGIFFFLHPPGGTRPVPPVGCHPAGEDWNSRKTRNIALLLGRPRSTMDSIRVSEAPDPGSIPGEATGRSER